MLVVRSKGLGWKIDWMCTALGLDSGFEGLMDGMLRLRADIGAPHTRAELGVDIAQAELIAGRGVADPSTATNPVPLTAEAARRIFDAAMRGETEW